MPASVAVAMAGILAGLALAPPALAPPAPALAAPAAPAADEVFVEVNPSTIEAGERVGIRASCPSNDKPATVRSDAFGRVTVEPRFGFLVRSVTIPSDQDPRSFTVRLTCPTGETATATLHVVNRTRPTRGPATGFGGTADTGFGLGGVLVVTGLLTVAGGVAIGLIALRRRRTTW